VGKLLQRPVSRNDCEGDRRKGLLGPLKKEAKKQQHRRQGWQKIRRRKLFENMTLMKFYGPCEGLFLFCFHLSLSRSFCIVAKLMPK